MIQHKGFVTAAVTLLCLGQTLVLIDSLSTVKFASRTSTNSRFQIRKRKIEFHQCPDSRKDRASSFRLFSISDFSSHPYSVYYGTSGSTAQQNFNQNDDINDVYGYGPDDLLRDESHDRNDIRQLQSMQDIPLLGGRRGATAFGTKYEEGTQPMDYDPRVVDEREQMFHENRMIEDQHEMMDHVNSLLCERDDLRMKLDAIVNDNIRLQNQQQKIDGGHPFVPSGQNQHYQETNPMANSCHMGQEQSTRSAVDNVMDELKNMQRTVQAVEAEQQGRNTNEGSNFIDSPPMGSEAQTVESTKSELEITEPTLQNLSSEQASYGYDSSTGDDLQQEYTNGNGSASSSASAFEQPHNFNNNGEEGRSQSVNGYGGSIKQDYAAEMFAGEYKVVIKAELKKKNGVEQIDVSNDAMRESPTVSGETFGSKYI